MYSVAGFLRNTHVYLFRFMLVATVNLSPSGDYEIYSKQWRRSFIMSSESKSH